MTAAAALGAVTSGEAHADRRAATGGPAPVSSFAPPTPAGSFAPPTPVGSFAPLRVAASAAPSAAVSGPAGSPPSVIPPAAPSVPPPAGPSAAPAHPAPQPSAAPAAAAPPIAPAPSVTPSTASGSPTPSAASGSPSPSAGSPRPDDEQSPLAGRPAGEGRQRPGRELTPQEIEQANDALDSNDDEPAPTDPAPVPALTPDASTSPQIGGPAQQALDGPAPERVRQMSLGAGIALVGMGLGFLAFRMRRTT